MLRSLFAFASMLALSLPVVARPPAPAPPERAQNPEVVLHGEVDRYLLNPFGEVDGLLLKDGTQVHLPPHLSRQLVEAVKPGASVRIAGESNTSRVVHAQTIENMQTHDRIADAAPDPKSAPSQRAGLRRMQAAGEVKTLLKGPRGETNGVVLDDGTIVRFPPRIGDQFETLLRPGNQLAASGYGTRTQYGNVFEATDLGADANAMHTLYETRLDRGALPDQDAGPDAIQRPRRQ